MFLPATMDIKERVANEYEKEIEVPKTPAVRPFLLCPVGLVGAGKTTVLKPLAIRFGLVRISSDEVRKILKGHNERYDAAPEIVAHLVRKYLSLGYGVAIDSDCASPHTKELIRETATTYGVPAVWIHIHPPESFVLEKLRNYTGEKWLTDDQEKMIENYYTRKPLHEHLDIPFVYTFDTSRPDLDAQCKAAEEKIRSMLS